MAPLNPWTTATKNVVLIATGKILDRHLGARRVTPEMSPRKQRGRAGTKQRDRWRPRQAGNMSHTGVGRDENRGVGDEPQHLGKIERSA
jgi:hypothetical protein